MARPKQQSFTGLRATSGHRTLAFGLVRVEVGMTPLLETVKRTQAKLLTPEHGEVKQVYRAADGKIIDKGDLIKGYAHAGGYVQLTESELDALKLDGDGTVELVAKAPAAELDPELFEKTLAIFPSDAAGAAGYQLLATLLRSKGWVLFGRTIDHGTTKTLAIRWSSMTETLVAHVLNYTANVRWANVKTIRNSMADVAEPNDEALQMAEQVFGTLADGFDFDTVTDEYNERLDAAIVAKAAGQTFEAPEQAEPAEVPDLMAALRATVAEAEGKPKAKAKAKKAEKVEA